MTNQGKCDAAPSKYTLNQRKDAILMQNQSRPTAKALLLETISKSAPVISQAFTINPGKSFSRKRKLGLEETLRLIISMGGTTIDSELRRYFRSDRHAMPSSSAFIQRRDRILPDAMHLVMSAFNDALPTRHMYQGLLEIGENSQI